MKNQGNKLSLIVLFVVALSGCEPGFYEQKLNSKIDDHLKVIQQLNAQIAKAESEIQRYENFDTSTEIGAKSDSASSSHETIQFENRSDFILLQKLCEVDQKWFTAKSSNTHKKLLDAIDSNKEIEVEPAACIRISSEKFQFGVQVLNSNLRKFIKPSPALGGKESHLITGGPFGKPLDRHFHPWSFDVTLDGKVNQIGMAFDPDQRVVQLEISSDNFSNPSIAIIPFRSRENFPSNELFVSVAPLPKSPTLRKSTVRLSLDTWLLASAIPLANAPKRVSLHFLKVIEVN